MNLPEIVCEGFEPTTDFSIMLRSSLQRVYDSSPEGSYCVAYLEKNAGLFTMTVTIRYSYGVIESVKSGSTPIDTVYRTMDDLHKKIRHWRKSRFGQYPSPRVLIVDDDIDSVRSLITCFTRNDCVTKMVTSGFLAANEMANNDYDLVVMDIMMPVMSGHESLLYCQRVLKEENDGYQYDKIPVITFSGKKKVRKFPQLQTFELLDHWHKSILFPQLLTKTAEVISHIRPATSLI